MVLKYVVSNRMLVSVTSKTSLLIGLWEQTVHVVSEFTRGDVCIDRGHEGKKDEKKEKRGPT